MKRVRILLLAVMLMMTLALSSCTVNFNISIVPWGTEVSAASPEAASTVAPTPIPNATPAPTSVAPSTLVLQEETEYQAVSASPDGSVELCVKDGMLHIRRDGQVIPVTMNESRGVPDAYSNLEWTFVRGTRALGSEGVVWSPDGRYFAIVNLREVMRNLQLRYDPVVVDTRTGEMFLAASFSNKLKDENRAAMVSAAFSADSRFLYAFLYARENRMVCIDLETLEMTELGHGPMAPSFPYLYMRGDEIVFHGYHKGNGTSALWRLDRDGSWQEKTGVTLPGYRSVCKPWRLLHSNADDRYILLTAPVISMVMADQAPLGSGQQFLPMLSCIVFAECSGDGFTGLDTGWWIPSLDAEKAEPIDLTALQEPVDRPMESVAFIGAAVSPDGRYLLLLGARHGERALLLLDLSDMRVRRLEHPAIDLIQSEVYLAWIGDTVYIGSGMSDAVAYTIR